MERMGILLRKCPSSQIQQQASFQGGHTGTPAHLPISTLAGVWLFGTPISGFCAFWGWAWLGCLCSGLQSLSVGTVPLVRPQGQRELKSLCPVHTQHMGPGVLVFTLDWVSCPLIVRSRYRCCYPWNMGFGPPTFISTTPTLKSQHFLTGACRW